MNKIKGVSITPNPLRRNPLHEISEPDTTHLILGEDIIRSNNTDEFVDLNPIVAVVATQQEKAPLKKLRRPRFGGYGIYIEGMGDTRSFWGAGCAKSQFPLIAFAIQRILQSKPPERHLIVRAEKGVFDHIGPNGHIWKAIARRGENSQGKPYEGYAPMKEIALALKTKQFELAVFDKTARPARYEEAKCAARVGSKQAIRHAWDLDEFADVSIFATGEIPEPTSPGPQTPDIVRLLQ